ncbi:MAG TPA: GAF domain-containing protein, partial [Gaiellaceae bacterium]|nr:GAF domain-containing protein [Gaiellaceae bacterium]
MPGARSAPAGASATKTVADALRTVVDSARTAAAADVAVVRVVELGTLGVYAAAGPPAVTAEIEGSRVTASPPEEEIAELDLLPAPLRGVAQRAQADAVLVMPVRVEGQVAGTLELFRTGRRFTSAEQQAARVLAAQVALALQARTDGGAAAVASSALELAADGLGAAADDGARAERIVRVAAAATNADACLIWRIGAERVEALARTGSVDAGTGRVLAESAGRLRGPSSVEQIGGTVAISLALGQPPFAVLQLLFPSHAAPADTAMRSLAGFAARATQALRAEERSRETRRELERTRDLLSVVGQATAHLSLAHTLQTVVDRIPALLDVAAVSVYLRENGRLETAASREVGGPHAVVAERLLDLALGPFRVRGFVSAADASRTRHLAPVRGALAESEIEAVHAVPLVAHGSVIGLLAVYPPHGRALTNEQSELLLALAGQIAVAVQNARLHEETKQLGTEREQALEAERVAARRLSALYEISRSFTQSLSLDRTLDAVASTLVELLGVDVAVIRVPDERGESLVAQAVHVSSPQLQPAMDVVFAPPEPVVPTPARRRLAA